MLGKYLTKEFRINNRIIFITYRKTIYGKLLEIKGKYHNRVAEVYTNANNPNYFGVILQEYWATGYDHRWISGKCIGYNFTYKQARKLAIDFVTKNKIYKG